MADLSTVYTKALAAVDEACLAMNQPTVSQRLADATSQIASRDATIATLTNKIENAKDALA